MVEDDGMGPLPSGWAMQIAPNGRKFFINHFTRNTTWVRSFVLVKMKLMDEVVFFCLV